MKHHAEPTTRSQLTRVQKMRIQARKHTFLSPSKISAGIVLLLMAGALYAPASGSADVGDQYLPQIPDAEGKKDEYGTEVQTAAAAPVTTTEAQA